jgi:hypothetical protein
VAISLILGLFIIVWDHFIYFLQFWCIVLRQILSTRVFRRVLNKKRNNRGVEKSGSQNPIQAGAKKVLEKQKLTENRAIWDPGCQMVYFQTQSRNLGIFWESLAIQEVGVF